MKHENWFQYFVSPSPQSSPPGERVRVRGHPQSIVVLNTSSFRMLLSLGLKVQLYIMQLFHCNPPWHVRDLNLMDIEGFPLYGVPIKGVIDMLEELSYTYSTTRSYQLPSIRHPDHKDVSTLYPASLLCLIILDTPYVLQGAEYTCTANKD